MLNCLINHIGLKGCSNAVPASGLYVNSLPGVDLRSVDATASDEQVNFNGVWADVQLRASKRFESDIRAEFYRKYKLKSITKSINIEKKIDANTTIAPATNLRGFTLELNLEPSLFVKSNLQIINIQSLFLYLSGNSNVDTHIKIYDLETGSPLQTIAVSAIPGWNTISVLGRYTARRLFVGYDSTAITSVTQDITQIINADFISQFILESPEFLPDPYDLLFYAKFIQGAQSTIAAPTTITQGNNTFGLSGIINIECSYEGIICNNLDVFTTAFWYLLGIELMNERLYTSRLNNYTVFDKNKAKELKQLFEATYKGGFIDEESQKLGNRMPGELYLAVDGVNLNTNDECLECSAPIGFRDARL